MEREWSYYTLTLFLWLLSEMKIMDDLLREGATDIHREILPAFPAKSFRTLSNRFTSCTAQMCTMMATHLSDERSVL